MDQPACLPLEMTGVPGLAHTSELVTAAAGSRSGIICYCRLFIRVTKNKTKSISIRGVRRNVGMLVVALVALSLTPVLRKGPW